MYSEEADSVAPKHDYFRRPVPVEDDETQQHAAEVEDQTLVEIVESDFDQHSADPGAEKRLATAVARYQAAHPGASVGQAVAALRASTVARRTRLGPASLDEVIVFSEGGSMTPESRGRVANSIETWRARHDREGVVPDRLAASSVRAELEAELERQTAAKADREREKSERIEWLRQLMHDPASRIIVELYLEAIAGAQTAAPGLVQYAHQQLSVNLLEALRWKATAASGAEPNISYLASLREIHGDLSRANLSPKRR